MIKQHLETENFQLSESPLTGRHFPALDGVRGLAISFVLLHHFAQGISFYGFSGNLLKPFLDSMWIGVDLFFVLSGFLITGILWDAREGGNYFTTFYARRLLRIFPLYYATLLIYFFVFPLLKFPHASQLAENQIWHWLYCSNYLVAYQGWPARPLAHFWSLAIEEQFYLFWPLLIYLFRRKFIYHFLISTILVAVAFRMFVYKYYGATANYVLTFTRMDALAIGGLLAVAARDGMIFSVIKMHAKKVLWFTFASLAMIFMINRGLKWRQWGVSMQMFCYLDIALLFSTMIYFCINGKRNPINKVFSSNILRFMGKYSYSIYVFHLLFDGAARSLNLHPSKMDLTGNIIIVYYLVYSCLISGVTIGVALISWNCFEKHFLKLKSRFVYN